jgi:non-ribosomal peptide synthetase component F
VVLNQAGAVCGLGEEGEVYLRSPYFTRGYYNDAARTREVFVVNPLTGADGDIVYRTGDLARVEEDGSVHLLGRADQ